MGSRAFWVEYTRDYMDGAMDSAFSDKYLKNERSSHHTFLSLLCFIAEVTTLRMVSDQIFYSYYRSQLMFLYFGNNIKR
jgi:hypothetical protein